MNPHIENVVMQFDLPDGAWTAEPYGNGHINETYLVTTGEKRFILQRVNGYVFPKPEDVMDNIERVTAFLKAQIEREGGDPARETLTLVKTHRGECFTYDREGGLWRMYLFVEDTVSYDLPDTPALFELSGEAFGKFQRQMGGFPADSLHETIHDFHNTPARYRQLEDAIARNEAGRLGSVTAEIEFCRQYEREVHALLDAMEAGEIPLRVTHNDTKLNNVLLDRQTGRGVCEHRGRGRAGSEPRAILPADVRGVHPRLFEGGRADTRRARNRAAADGREADDTGMRHALSGGLPERGQVFPRSPRGAQSRPRAHAVQAGALHGGKLGADGGHCAPLRAINAQ